MSTFSLSDLAALPTPRIIEEIDFETRLAARKAKFIELAASYGINHTTINLETDPGAILLQEAAFEEGILRARGNDIARARYIYFAVGSELDQHGAFYDAVRLPGESDARFTARIILAIQGRSTGGTAPRYRSVAMTSSLRVADAVVYSTPPDPTVRVAVFAGDNNGVADNDLLATVRAAVTAPAVRMVNDTIVVEPAVIQVVNVAANVWLLPDASEAIVASVAAALPGQWIAESGLGRDLTHDWLKGKIMGAGGFYRVTITAPSSDVIMAPAQAARIGTVTLTIEGRGF